jgi:hypothetical protein
MFNKIPSIIIETECRPIGGIQLSTQETYQLLESRLMSVNIPDILILRVSLSEGGIMSHNREYLRVVRREYVFDICLAPFGTQSFISWRLREKISFMEKFWRSLLILKVKKTAKPKVQTFYQEDASFMFIYCVKNILAETVDMIKLERGIRGPMELKESGLNVIS